MEKLQQRSSLPICGGFTKKSCFDLQNRVENSLTHGRAAMGYTGQPAPRFLSYRDEEWLGGAVSLYFAFCQAPGGLAGTSNELDVQNGWEENTHTHTVRVYLLNCM